MHNFSRKNLITYLLLPITLIGEKIDASENILEDTRLSVIDTKKIEDKNDIKNAKLCKSENEKLNKKKIKIASNLISYFIISQLDLENPQSEDESKKEYRNFNIELFNDLKKIKFIGSGVQGYVSLCENTITHKKYVLKKTKKENISFSRTIYEKFPEFLACEKLANFKCKFIAKPLAYRQISDDSAEILLEYAENNASLDSLTIKEKKEVLKQILYVREQLKKIGLIHGDICRKNFNIEKKKNGDIVIHVYDYGYSSKIKDSYSKNDVIMYMHPFIDIQQIYKSIKCIFNEEIIEILNKNVKKELPNLYDLIFKDVWWPWNRRIRASKILKISLDDCDKFVNIVEKWVNDIKT